jgi:hypothetical protein
VLFQVSNGIPRLNPERPDSLENHQPMKCLDQDETRCGPTDLSGLDPLQELKELRRGIAGGAEK